MSLRITFDVFSGRPNPVVVFDGNDATMLLQKLRSTAKLSGTEAQAPSESRLGYRGLVVEQTGTPIVGVPARVRVVSGKAFAPAVAYRTSDDVEDFVFTRAKALDQPSAPPEVLDEIRSIAVGSTDADTASGATHTAVPPVPITPCPCGPVFEPLWWNDGSTKQGGNNCYNYATNYRTDTFAQPGLGTGQMYASPITSIGMSAAAVRDALVQTNQPKCPAVGHLVALFIAPSIDFHWYRLGRDGMWTHKPGPTPATNKDNSGVLITDPRAANRGIYTQFCGFMIVQHGHIKIR